MIASNPNAVCEQSRTYYYDYLCGEAQEYIPAEMLNHIDKCHFCQTAVNRLKNVLSAAEEHAGKNTGQKNSVVIAGLKLHFSYIGTFVTCETTRPFLPSLADPTLEVGVPTPITVHLDKCQQCANDLETIQKLNLAHKQLCRLGQLFAGRPAEDAITCSEAQSAILAVVTMVFRETNVEVLKHLCTCPDCRELLYQHRETVHGELLRSKRIQRDFPCEAVSVTDIFDYVIPYGIDPANDQYAKFRQSLTSHASTCPACLAKMQKLHNTAYSILERKESGIVTCFKVVDDLAQASIVSSPDDVYQDWPIEVQVFDKSKRKPVVSTDFGGSPRRLKQRVSVVNLKQFIRPAVAAAAVLIVALLLFNGPVAKAVDLGQIYKALERIKNIYITTFVLGKAKPIQEVWMSQALNIKMFKTETEYVLWDINGKSRKAINLNTGLITMVEPDDEMLVKVEETMEVPWGLLPFDNMFDVPKDAKWQQVADDNIETTIAGTQVFDLTWTEERLGGSINYKKWRGYIDIKTKLPKRVERWRKRTKEEEYQLLTITKVAYPAFVEIRAIVEGAGF